MSISELIEGQAEDGTPLVPTIRTAETVRSQEIALAIETALSTQANRDTKEIVNFLDPNAVDSSQLSQAISPAPTPVKISEQLETPVAERSQTLKPHALKAIQKPVRESGPSKRGDVPNKDIMRTLVVEDGHWPVLKGLAESAKDLDDNDEDLDDLDRRSPFQTIVPNDD